MADAYKVLADTSFPVVLRNVVTMEGVEVEEVAGQSFPAGSYVLADELTARDRERAENGDLDHLLESASLEDAEEYRRAREFGLFIPEHEAERIALMNAGHDVVERDQLLELRSAGAEAAREAQAAAYADGADARPQITEQATFVEVPSITEAVKGDGVLPKDAQRVDDTVVAALKPEMVPGLQVGPELAKAEGADPEKVDEDAKKASRRGRRPQHEQPQAEVKKSE